MHGCVDVDECAVQDGSGADDDSFYTNGAEAMDGSGMPHDEALAVSSVCPLYSTCVNTHGSYDCVCNGGWKKVGASNSSIVSSSNYTSNTTINTTNASSGGSTDMSSNAVETCSDIDECAADPNACDSNAKCTNLPGSFSCSCKEGWYGDGFDCTDVDECGTLPPVCHAHAVCKNTAGSFECSCHSGWEGNGESCVDVDECADDATNALCSSGERCTNTAGSFDCVCDHGFAALGGICLDVDECAAFSGSGGGGGGGNGLIGCHANAICTNTVGSYTCACEDGWIGDGTTTCVDINECVESTACHDEAVCTNLDGSYACACNEGFAGDGVNHCTDIDECSSTTLVDCAGRRFSDADCTAYGGANGPATCFDLMLAWSNDSICDSSKPSFDCVELGCDGTDCTMTNHILDHGGIFGECQQSPSAFVVRSSCNAADTCTNTMGGFICTPADVEEPVRNADAMQTTAAASTSVWPGLIDGKDDDTATADLAASTDTDASSASGEATSQMSPETLIKVAIVIIVVAALSVIAVMLFVRNNPYEHHDGHQENHKVLRDIDRELDVPMDRIGDATSGGPYPKGRDSDTDSGVTLDAALPATSSIVSNVSGTSSSKRISNLGAGNYSRSNLPGPRRSQRPQKLQQVVINNGGSLDNHPHYGNASDGIPTGTVVTTNDGDDDRDLSSGRLGNRKERAQVSTIPQFLPKDAKLSVRTPVIPVFPSAPDALTHLRTEEPRSGSVLANRKWTLGRRVTPAAGGGEGDERTVPAAFAGGVGAGGSGGIRGAIAASKSNASDNQGGAGADGSDGSNDENGAGRNSRPTSATRRGLTTSVSVSMV